MSTGQWNKHSFVVGGKMRRAILISLLLLSGCACNQNLTTYPAEIEQRHGVVIKIKDTSNQSGLCKLLAIIDKDLERCPQYFKDNIGPIFIERSFNELGPQGMFLVGYVDSGDMWGNYPIHIKNRSALEKVLFPVPREDQVFLHEASHSFEFNIKDDISDKWDVLYKEFSEVQTNKYNKSALVLRFLSLEVSKPDSMASSYASVDHHEDFAETHCFLRRNNIELIKDKYPVLYKKCKIVERFTNPPTVSAKAAGLSSQSADGSFKQGL
jgi:hypothetical protein